MGAEVSGELLAEERRERADERDITRGPCINTGSIIALEVRRSPRTHACLFSGRLRRPVKALAS